MYTMLCTLRLQPPRDDYVRVQWFSSVFMIRAYCFLVETFVVIPFANIAETQNRHQKNHHSLFTEFSLNLGKDAKYTNPVKIEYGLVLIRVHVVMSIWLQWFKKKFCRQKQVKYPAGMECAYHRQKDNTLDG